MDVLDSASDVLQRACPPVPPPVEDWLGQTALLNGVPFENLVPDVRMLPPESIRFFYIDANWLGSLADGAFSIGVHSNRDIRFDRVMQHRVREATDIAAGKLRAEQRGEVPPVLDARIRAGFLLRSAIVSGWPGLEIEAFDGLEATSQKLPPLRIERLSPDVLIAILPSIPGRIHLNEPAEGFHFATSGGTLDGVRDPAQLTGNDPVPRSGDPVAVPLRNSTANDGVLDIAKLGNSLASGLANLLSPPPVPPPLEAAEFALQMIDPPDQKRFIAAP